MTYIVTLAESLIHPTLVTASHIFVTILVIYRMIVHIIKSCFSSATISTNDLAVCLVSGSFGFLLFEVALLSELILVVLIIRALYI